MSEARLNHSDMAQVSLQEQDTDLIMADRPPLPPKLPSRSGREGSMSDSPAVIRTTTVTTQTWSASPSGMTQMPGTFSESVGETAPFWEREAKRAEKEAEKSRSRIRELEARLAASTQNSQRVDDLSRELSIERSLRETTQEELRKKTAEARDATKRWKQTARELNDFRSSAQGFYTVTDEYLIDLATRLRFNIQNFVIQYYDRPASSRTKIERTMYFDLYIKPITRDHELYLCSQERCPTIIQRFLWEVVVKEIFGNFRWAGAAAQSAQRLCDILKPAERPVDPADPRASDPEAERKFQRWRASMAGLLTSAVEEERHGPDRDSIHKAKERIFTRVWNALSYYLKVPAEDWERELYHIIEDAIAFDKEMSRQLARVRWVFTVNDAQSSSGPGPVRPEKGFKHPVGPIDGPLVVQPAMVKRGRSTGEDYGTEIVLLPLVVSDEPPDKSVVERRRPRQF